MAQKYNVSVVNRNCRGRKKPTIIDAQKERLKEKEAAVDEIMLQMRVKNAKIYERQKIIDAEKREEAHRLAAMCDGDETTMTIMHDCLATPPPPPTMNVEQDDNDQQKTIAIEVPIEHEIYYNDLIMEKVVSHVSNFKHRLAIQLASHRLYDISQCCDHISLDDEPSNVLDACFQRVDNRIGISFAGNQLNLPVLVTSKRVFTVETKTVTQPADTIAKLTDLFDRVGKQIEIIRLGGLIYWEDVIGLLPDHQLVLTTDLASTISEKCKNIKRICLKNTCIDTDTVNNVLKPDSFIRNGVETLCLHGVWFDELNDYYKFLDFPTTSLHSLYLSDYCGKLFRHLAQVLEKNDQMLDMCYMSLDYRSFDNDHDPPRKSISSLINRCRKVSIAMSINSKGPYMFHALKDLTRFDQIVWLEIQIERGTIDSTSHASAFKKLVRLINLETLRISGHNNALSPVIVGDICKVLYNLRNMKEFVLRNAAYNVPFERFSALVECLKNLQVIGLNRCPHLTNEHILLIAKNNPQLRSLQVIKCRKIRSEVFVDLLVICRELQTLVVSGYNTSYRIYELLADKNITPNIVSASLCGNMRYLSDGLQKRLKLRFDTFYTLGTPGPEMSYRMARRGFKNELEWIGQYGLCPCCHEIITLND